MLASVDGKIDGASLRAVTPDAEYESTGDQLGEDAWVCGRVTMQQHFADEGTFRSKTGAPAGPQTPFVARHSASYAIAIDTHGKLLWKSSDIDGDHLISIVCEAASADYLEYLREKNISYIVAGASMVDLPEAATALKEHFGIETLLLEGGGNINGAFLAAGLVDELSLLLVPGIDGRHHVPAVFDGLEGDDHVAVPLKLKSVERRAGDVLWLRYEAARK
jgi:riboflavin biosynthesis pyrimidine reductase